MFSTKSLRRAVSDAPSGFAVEAVFIMAAAAISITLLKAAFFHFAPWIWSQRTSVNDLTPWMAHWRSSEGIETYALYVLTLAAIPVSVAIYLGLKRLAVDAPAWRRFAAIAVACTVLGVALMHATFPVGQFPSWPVEPTTRWTVLLSVAVIMATLLAIHRRWPAAAAVISCLAAIPLVFVATDEAITFDYSFVFFPAHQLNLGRAITDTYFQYDVLVTALAALWMKAGLALDTFPAIIQLSYLLLIVGLYFGARRFFVNKELAAIFVIFTALIKLYFSAYGIVRYPQWSPIRTDLWALVFLVVVFKGPYHWLIGLVVGILMLVSHSFGLIYSIAYLQLILCLGLVSSVFGEESGGFRVLARHLIRARVPLAMIAASFVIDTWLFGVSNNYAYYYVLLGIGFIRITASTAFWLFVPVVPLVSLLLLHLRPVLTQRYFESACALVFLGAGNLVYFFGQTNEMHLYLALMPVLLLVFVVFELLRIKLSTRIANGARWNHLDVALGCAAVFAVISWCSDNIVHKIRIQYDNVSRGQLFSVQPFRDRAGGVASILGEVNRITAGSDRVQFFTMELEHDFTDGADTEFLLYYQSHRQSRAMANPMFTQVFNAPLVRHMQSLLDEGYYLLLTTAAYHALFETKLEGIDAVRPVGDKYVLVSITKRIGTTP